MAARRLCARHLENGRRVDPQRIDARELIEGGDRDGQEDGFEVLPPEEWFIETMVV